MFLSIYINKELFKNHSLNVKQFISLISVKIFGWKYIMELNILYRLKKLLLKEMKKEKLKMRIRKKQEKSRRKARN